MIDAYLDLIFLSSVAFNSFTRIILMPNHQILVEFLMMQVLVVMIFLKILV